MRAWRFQFHLSTLIVVVVAANPIVWLNARPEEVIKEGEGSALEHKYGWPLPAFRRFFHARPEDSGTQWCTCRNPRAWEEYRSHRERFTIEPIGDHWLWPFALYDLVAMAAILAAVGAAWELLVVRRRLRKHVESAAGDAAPPV